MVQAMRLPRADDRHDRRAESHEDGHRVNALVIRKQWLDLILAGRKTWEIRGSATRVRGPIALIESRSGTVVGVCNLTDCVGPLTLKELHGAVRHHRADLEKFQSKLPYRRTHAWVLAGA